MNSQTFRLNDDAITIAKRTGDGFAVWFKPSHSFVLFEEPAYRVFCMLAKDIPPTEIANKCQLDFNLPVVKSRDIIFKIIKRIKALCKSANIPGESQKIDLPPNKASFHIFSKRRYLIGNKIFAFVYGDIQLERCFDPLLSHLTSSIPSTIDNQFELFEYSGKLVLRTNNKIVTSFSTKAINQLMGAVFQQILSLVYNIHDQDWMINLHASGIHNERSAILFPAQTGKGKTTLATLLQANGFPVIADDFIAVDSIKKHAFRFPVAISVKEGAVKSLSEYYSLLSTTVVSEKAITAKKVRYVPLENSISGTPFSFPVKALVFINYTPCKALHFEKIDLKTALPILLSDTWVNPTPENIVQFFCWLDTVQFYRLSYCENRPAIEIISNLFLS